jgi:hypothetical protein
MCDARLLTPAPTISRLATCNHHNHQRIIEFISESANKRKKKTPFQNLQESPPRGSRCRCRSRSPAAIALTPRGSRCRCLRTPRRSRCHCCSRSPAAIALTPRGSRCRCRRAAIPAFLRHRHHAWSCSTSFCRPGLLGAARAQPRPLKLLHLWMW